MKNKEKYRDEIFNYKELDFCKEFMKPKVLTQYGRDCVNTCCSQCQSMYSIWLEDEYKEPEPKYRDVTVDDIGKMVEVECDGLGWRARNLVTILPEKYSSRYVCEHPYNEKLTATWNSARIKE